MDRSSRSLGYQVLTALGFLFIGLALITLISANWQEIPRGLRMAGVVAITLSVNLYALYRYQSGALTAAGNWLFLGGLCYGASIMLISQIYHIGRILSRRHFLVGHGRLAHRPFTGKRPADVVERHSGIYLVLYGILAEFLSHAVSYFSGCPEAWHMYRAKQNNLLFMALVGGAALWLEYSLAWWLGDGRGYHPAADHLSLGGGPAVALLWCGTMAGGKKGQPARSNTAFCWKTGRWRISVLALLVFSFKAPWRALLETRWEMPLASFLNSLGLSVVALLLIPPCAKNPHCSRPWPRFFISASWLRCRHCMIPRGAPCCRSPITFFFYAVASWLVVEGLRTARSYQFYLGIFMILMTGFLRYLDFIGDYVGAALLFALLAAILLAAAHYWHRRYPDAGGSGL